ncbi:MAG: heme-binding protein [Pseudomonadota bacterium]
MRWVLIGLAVVLVIVAAGFAWTEWQMARIETPQYTVEREDGAFEVREYAPMLTASVAVDGNREEAVRKGFSQLADYIFGANGGSAKIEMTAPVEQEPQAGETIAMTAPVEQEATGAESWRVSFVMPSKFTLDTLPQPENPGISLDERPGGRVAAITFSGIAGTDEIARASARLMDFLERNDLTPAASPRFAFYDPPWRIPFLRRNEVLVPLADNAGETPAAG